MSQSSITVMVCDRCGLEQSICDREYFLIQAWGKIAAEQSNGPHRVGQFGTDIGGRTRAKDICESCMRSLIGWWEAGKHDGT